MKPWNPYREINLLFNLKNKDVTNKMKYIDARTQESLKQGIMEFLNLSASEMIQIFMSIYEDTEKEPWEWVSDFLSDNMVDEVLEHIQMFHLSRRLEGTDPTIWSNSC